MKWFITAIWLLAVLNIQAQKRNWYFQPQISANVNSGKVSPAAYLHGGFKVKQFYTGLGLGYDPSLEMSIIPLSAEIGRMVKIKDQQFFIYVRPGISIPEYRSDSTNNFGWLRQRKHYSNGGFVEIGAGINFLKKLYIGPSWTYNSYSASYLQWVYNPSTGRTEEYMAKDIYKIYRLGLRLSFIL